MAIATVNRADRGERAPVGAHAEARERVAMEPLALSILDACAAIGVKRSTLYALLGSNQLPSIKVKGRRLILVSAIRVYLKSLEGKGE